MKRTNALIKTVLYILLIFVSAITLIPVVYTIFSSFKDNMEILNNSAKILPKVFRFENYAEAWRLADFKTYTLNSVIFAGVSAVGCVFVSAISGYVYARASFPGKNVLFVLIISTMFVCLGSITLYPTLKVAKLLHINNSILGVALINIFGANAANVFLARNFVMGLPRELEEAASIDGCDFFTTGIRIVLPLLKPVMATISILCFSGAWNDYVLPMVFTLGKPQSYPLTVGLVALQSQGEAATSWNLLLAGTTMSIVPILIIYLAFNKYFTKGLTEGAVKG